MLTNLLPGLREIRAPLISGYIWLVFFFLAFHDDLPTRQDASPTLKPLFDLGHDLSALGIATVSGVAAYLVGSAVQELLKLLCKVPQGKPFYGEPGTHLSAAGRLDLGRAVEIRIQAIRRRLFQVALSPGEKGVDDEPSARAVEAELPLIRTLLLGEHADLIGELDRLQAEADLRITVAVPLVFFAVLLSLEVSAGWLLTMLAAGLLLAQGYQRQVEVGDLLAKALRIGKVTAPSLESLDASAAAAVERMELEEDLARKMSEGHSPMAAFRLGNLQATGENFEGALTSLRFAAENGVIHAYAEMGLVYERVDELDDAERAYRDGEKRKDGRAAERLADLLRRLERNEEALETVRQARDEEGGKVEVTAQPRVSREGSRIVDYRRRAEQGDAKAALNLGLLRQRRGEWEAAIEDFERATRLDEGDAQAWLNFGRALIQVRRGRESGAAYEEALAILERTLGGEHLEVASALLGLGRARNEMKEFEAAKPLLERALAIQEREIGPDDLEVAITLGNLSGSELGLGEVASSTKIAERAMGIMERHLGPDHPQVAVAMQNLGVNYKETGDYVKSMELLERALSIHEKEPGPNGNQLAFSLVALGEILDIVGEHSKARPLHERALAIKEEGLSEGHVSIAISLAALGVSLRGLGDYQRALALHETAAWQLEAGGYAIELPRVMLETAITLRHLGRFADARSVSRRGLTLFEEGRSSDARLHGEILVEVGNALNDQDFALARQHLQEGRDLIEKVVGRDHLYLVWADIGLGKANRRLDNNHSSQRLLRTALRIIEDSPVAQDPARALGLREMAETLFRQGRLEDAKESILQSIDSQKRVAGDAHPELATSYEVLASICAFTKDEDGAAAAQKRAEEIKGNG